MVFLYHVQNLHIHAEKTHKDFGAHCMKYVNFVHDSEKQYRSTVPAVRPLSTGLQVTEDSWEQSTQDPRYRNFGTFHMHAIAKGAHACHSSSTAALNRSKSACRIHWEY